MILKLFLIIHTFVLAGLFDADPNSAIRHKTESFEQAESRNGQLNPKLWADTSARSSATSYHSLDFSKLPKLHDVKIFFNKIRDERFLEPSTTPDFKRRNTWLLPHDGCWIRAALVNHLAKAWNRDQANKLFIFGELRVQTENAEEGEVSWWYHVAPVVADTNGKPWVLDPAINPRNSLEVKDWIKTMVPDLAEARYALCGPGAYGPASICENSEAIGSDRPLNDIEYYLEREWDNLNQLLRKPELELGEFPPWIVS